MERLVSTAEASQILGISVQGIHYRIKKNQLKTVKKDNKIFVYVDEKLKINSNKSSNQRDEMLKLKDEQIVLLKDTNTWMKKQYKQEIKRLEKNQNKIVDVFKSEILLIKQAFNEMQNIYKLEHKEEVHEEIEFMSINEFFIFMKKHDKTNIEIKTIILNKIKINDKRFIYNTKEKKVIIYKDNFLDLI